MSEFLSIAHNDKHSRSSKTSELGILGEEYALNFLISEGFDIIMANFKVPIGRNRVGTAVSGEIDLIAFEEDVLCFIEVKTRRSNDLSSALSAVDLRKQRQIIRIARRYRKIFRLNDQRIRFDVVSVLIEKKLPEIKLFRGFWNESKFHKRKWTGDY